MPSGLIPKPSYLRTARRVMPLSQVGPSAPLRSEMAARDASTKPLVRASALSRPASRVLLVGQSRPPLPVAGKPGLTDEARATARL